MSCICRIVSRGPCVAWRSGCAPDRAPAAQPPPDPDALYAQREDLAERAAGGGHLGKRGCSRTRRTSRPRGSSRARATGSAATRRSSRTARRCSKQGIAAGARPRSRSQPNRPEGHFWLAANMGALAESFGLRQGLKYRGDDQGRAAERCCGSIPRSSRDRPTARWAAGTSRCRACSAAARRSPKSTCASRSPTTRTAPPRTSSSPRRSSTTSREGRSARELQTVLDAPLDPEWAPEDREFKEQGRDCCKLASKLRTSGLRSDSTPRPDFSTCRTLPDFLAQAVRPAPCA